MELSQAGSRRRRNKEQILDLLRAFESSSLSVKEFCKTHNINAVNFHKWRSRYNLKAGGKKRISSFASVDIVSSRSGLFAEVNGIRIYQPVSASFLKELLP
jgi:transposase-like protein